METLVGMIILQDFNHQTFTEELWTVTRIMARGRASKSGFSRGGASNKARSSDNRYQMLNNISNAGASTHDPTESSNFVQNSPVITNLGSQTGNESVTGMMDKGRASKSGFSRGVASNKANTSVNRNHILHNISNAGASTHDPTESSNLVQNSPVITNRGSQAGNESGNSLSDNADTNLGEQPTPNRRGINHGTEIPDIPERRILITIENDYFQPKEVARTLGALCKSYVTGPWLTWKEVEPETKDDMWSEFEARYRWNDDTKYVERVFNERCKIHWATCMYNGRRDQLELLKTNDISKLMGRNPSWCHIDVWNLLVARWCKEEWINKSIKASENRRTEKFGTITKHTCGSIPIVAHTKILEAELGRKAHQLEIFRYTHTKRQKGEASSSVLARKDFVDGKSYAIDDLYVKNVEEKFGTDPDSQPTFDCDSWYDTTGGFTKGRLYGFGKGDSALLLVGAKSTPSNKSTQENEEAICRMKEDLEVKFQEKVEALEAERRKEKEEIEARMQKDKDEMEERFESMRKMMYDMLNRGG